VLSVFSDDVAAIFTKTPSHIAPICAHCLLVLLFNFRYAQSVDRDILEAKPVSDGDSVLEGLGTLAS
jgi:hypothetical protein